MNLPMVLGLVVFSLVSGAGTTAIGYYTIFFLVSAILHPIGAGLITTWTVNTGHAKWIGYQFIYGAGVCIISKKTPAYKANNSQVGFAMQLPLIVAQTVLKLKHVPVGTAMIMFIQTLGGALFVSVSQVLTLHSLSDSASNRLTECLYQ